MEDMERYGDYNEVDGDEGRAKSPVALILKILVIALCFLVVGVILFRVILFNYYPKAMKNIYFDSELSEYYAKTGGDIGAKTQKLRAPYDDPDFASFFADNLIIIEGVGQLQLSLRYNSSALEVIEEKYGVELSGSADELFDITLERVPFDSESDPTSVGTLIHTETDSALMYTYIKLVFDGVDYLDPGTPDWLRVKIAVRDIPEAEPYYILVYENTDEYSLFSDYKLSGKERPND